MGDVEVANGAKKKGVGKFIIFVAIKSYHGYFRKGNA